MEDRKSTSGNCFVLGTGAISWSSNKQATVALSSTEADERLMTEDGTELTDAKVYRSLVGRLLYVTHSRPDVAYSVGVLSRFMHRPTM
nr:uncharacterized mitochondrial protein AtMg00810-like [Tanacetum cinerariifolium]